MAQSDSPIPSQQTNNEPNLNCESCCQMFQSPRLLPCLHTLCALCIEYVSEANEACPVCGQDFGAKPPGGFPLNSIIDALVEDVKLKELARQKKVLCDVCPEETAEAALSRCPVCCENMCDFHTQAHAKSRKTVSHEVMSFIESVLNGVSGSTTHALSAKVSRCPAHQQYPLDRLCTVCNVAVCAECVLAAHRTHAEACKPSREITAETLERLCAAQLQTAKSNRILADVLERVDGAQATLQAHRQEARQQIDAAFAALAIALENRRQTLSRELEALAGQEAAKLNAQRKRLTTHRESLTRAQELAAQIAKASPELNIVGMATHVFERLQALGAAVPSLDLQPVSSGKMKCVCTVEPAIAAIDALGSLHDGNVDPSCYRLACVGNGDTALITLTHTVTEQTDNTAAAAPPQAFTVRVTGSDGEPDLQLQLRTSDRDQTAAVYQAEFAPSASVEYLISACASGGNRHVCDSPLLYTHKYRFTSLAPSLSVNDAGQLVSTTAGHPYAVATPALPQTGITFWAIDCVRNTGHWLGLGIIANTQPDVNSYSNPTCFMWAGSGQVYIRGINNQGHGGWSGFRDGDVAVFKLDMGARTLSMHVPRLRRTFSISIPASQQQYYIHANLHSSGSTILLRPATLTESRLLH